MMYYSSNGAEVYLDKAIGSGGEGKIYSLRDNGDMVAKIYNRWIGEEKASKLSAMVRLQNPRLASISAWPMDTLHSEEYGPVKGFIMKRVLGKSIHLLYSPKSRIVEFPNAGWDFLLHAAANLARAFAVVHECGHVIGDVNHSNAYIQKDATVMLIDCDSFQINDSGKRYFCEVGVMTHQPPELQSVSTFRGLVREENHDNFGLAVLIFQLLFMGRHPFSGKYLGEGEMPIERAIQEGRFAYGISAKVRMMEEPPNSISINAVSKEIINLFERAFMQRKRPRAREWVLAMEVFRRRLRACSNHFHKYYEGLKACPLCEVESKTGIMLFNYTGLSVNRLSVFNITAIIKEIESIQSPGELPSIPAKTSIKASPDKEYALYRKKRTTKGLVALFTALAGVLGPLTIGAEAAGAGAVLFMLTAFGAAGFIVLSEKDETRRMIKKARTEFYRAGFELDKHINEWYGTAGDRKFNELKARLLKLGEDYNQLAMKGQRMIGEVEANLRKYQLQKFLDSFRIYDAKIDRINHTKKATLQSYGIETAADIDPRYLAVIPGIGPKYANSLMEWRRKIESRFVFNPNKGADTFQLAEIHKRINEEKSKLEDELSNGAEELRRIREETLNIRKKLMVKIEMVLTEYAKAEANLKCCTRSR